MVTKKKIIKEEDIFDEEVEAVSEEGPPEEADPEGADEEMPAEEGVENEEAAEDAHEDDLGAEDDADIIDDPKVSMPSRDAYQMTADVPVQVVVVMGKKTISVRELADMKMGQVVDLSRPVNEMVDIIAGGKLIAKGELVDIDGKMGVRVVKMVR